MRDVRETGRRGTAIDPRKQAALQLAQAMRNGQCPTDRSFDRFLPESLRLVAPEYWTPLAVVKRAAAWIDDLGIRRVADIGSGAGKFCVASALFGNSRLIGLERYASLVAAARQLADLFDLGDRVQFVNGSLGEVPDPIADAYYFFNPFTDYRLGPDHPTDSAAESADATHADDIAAAEDLLRRVRAGTWILTYNGFGGRMPDGYRVVHVERDLRGELRLWQKQRDAPRRRRAAARGGAAGGSGPTGTG